MTRLFLATLLLLSVSGPSLLAQRPDFSGKWTMDEKRSGSPTHDTFVSPVIWVVAQTPKTLSLDITRGPKTASLAYTMFDKAPSADAGSPSYRAYWDGDRLVTETLQNIQGKTVTTREVLSMSPAGEMMVERVVEVEHGYTMKGAQNYSSVKDFFTKATP